MMTHEQRYIRRVRIREMVAAGTPVAEVADHFGVSTHMVCGECKRAGVPYDRPKPPPPQVRPSSYAVLADLINTDMTLEQIGEARGISRQRVGQIAQLARGAGIEFRYRDGVPAGEPTGPVPC